MAVALRPFAARESVEFLAGNTPTPVPSRYILPFEKIKEIAREFRNTGTRSADLTWEEI
jgi:hypothetical protein